MPAILETTDDQPLTVLTPNHQAAHAAVSAARSQQAPARNGHVESMSEGHQAGGTPVQSMNHENSGPSTSPGVSNIPAISTAPTAWIRRPTFTAFDRSVDTKGVKVIEAQADHYSRPTRKEIEAGQ